MKYKYCPDCGSKITHSRSQDGWGERYDCDCGCGLSIRIQHGETMHAAGDTEEWIRKQPEPRKPREMELVYRGNGTWAEWPKTCHGINEQPIRFREVID